MTSSDLLGGDGEREKPLNPVGVEWFVSFTRQPRQQSDGCWIVLVKSGGHSVLRRVFWSRVAVTLFRDACCGQEWRSFCSQARVSVRV